MISHKEFVWQLTHQFMMITIFIIKDNVPSIDIIDFDYPHWHTIDDTVENCYQKD